MLLAILAIWFGYKKGRDSGRSGALWGVISGAAFIGTQFLVAILIGAGMGLGIAFWGWSETIYEDNQIWITLVSIAASIAVILLIFKYLDRIPDEPVVTEPPPPPTFDQTE